MELDALPELATEAEGSSKAKDWQGPGTAAGEPAAGTNVT